MSLLDSKTSNCFLSQTLSFASQMPFHGRTGCPAVGYMTPAPSSFKVKAAEDLFVQGHTFPRPACTWCPCNASLTCWPDTGQLCMKDHRGQYSLQNSPPGGPRHFWIFITTQFQPLPSPISSSPFTGARPALQPEGSTCHSWSLSPLTFMSISTPSHPPVLQFYVLIGIWFPEDPKRTHFPLPPCVSVHPPLLSLSPLLCLFFSIAIVTTCHTFFGQKIFVFHSLPTN